MLVWSHGPDRLKLEEVLGAREIGVAVLATLDESYCRNVRIALGAVAPMPIRARNTERVLEGKEINDGLIEQAAQAAAAESRPITDVRASADYRREMVKVFANWAIRRVFGKEQGAGDETTAVMGQGI